MLLKTTLSLAAARRPVCLAMVGLLTGFVGAVALAQPVEIGRSTLTLPDAENWKVKDLDSANLGYSGDANGAMVMGTKQLTYLSTDKLVKAVFVSKVTKGGVAGVSMTWTNPCLSVKENSNIFKADKGNLSNVDCLLVLRLNQIDTFVNSAAQLKKSLGDVRPDTKSGFYVQYGKSMGAGGYAFSEVLMANDFKGLEGDAVKTESTIPPAVLSWAVAFAKSNAAAVDSLSGKWSIPALVFNSK